MKLNDPLGMGPSTFKGGFFALALRERSCLTVFLTVFVIFLGNVGASFASSLPIIRIDAEKMTPRDIGIEIGRQSKALLPDIERYYDTYLASLLNQSHFDDLARSQLPSLVEQIPKEYRDEWQGVVDSWSIVHANKLGDGYLSLNEYQLMNLLPDLGFPPDGIGIGVFGRASSVGTIVGRNLDWASNPELRATQAITVYGYKDRTVVSPGFAGVTSMLNGFNSYGLFLAYFDAELYSPYRKSSTQTSNTNTANVFMLRQALETQRSASRASSYLRKQIYSTDRSLMVADKREVLVLEYPKSESAEIRYWDTPTQTSKPWDHPQQVAVIGCHVLAELKNQCLDASDSIRWQRLNKLLDFSVANPAGVASVGNVLADTANRNYELFSSLTLQSMIYLPGNNGFYLYAVPAGADTSKLVSPVYIPYSTLVSGGTSVLGTDTDIDVQWLIWLVLIAMLGIVLWVMRKP